MKSNSHKSIIWESNVALKLLISFFDTSKALFEREVHKKTGVSAGAVNKYLRILAGENYLLLEKRGRMNFYRLNRDNPAVKRLKAAYTLSSPIAAQLGAAGKKLGTKIYLFGSVARGEDDENSDWDILVIGDIDINKLEAEMSLIRKKSSKKINLSVFRRNEWLKLPKEDLAFYERLEKDRIEII